MPPYGQRIIASIPSAVGRPEDIAALAYFLVSVESAFITGQTFIADGGMTHKMIYEE